MPRSLLVPAMLVAALAFTPAARAAIPVPTVSTGGMSVAPSLVSGSESELAGGPTLIIDGFGVNPPTLVAAAGAAVTITTDMAVDSVQAWLGPSALAVAQTGERTYAATLPADLALPAELGVGLDVTTATHRLTSGWTLNLAAPPAPQPPPAPLPAPPVASAPQLTSVRLAGRRLTATVTCASACAGTLTLKTPSLRVARLEFTRAGTVRAAIRPAVLRHLRRHRVKRLRAVLTPAGGSPTVTQPRLNAA